MIHYFCPFCWVEISKNQKTCRQCGRDTGEWNDKSYTEKLLYSLSHFEPSTVYRARYILGERREQLAVQPLIDLLKKTMDPFLMEVIIDALSKIGDQRIVPLLIDMLKNSSFLVRGKAASVLCNFGSQEEVKAALKEATNDHSNYVRNAAKVSLAKLTKELDMDRANG
ncbi:MAG TPA: HEAT repeat domain-containing protein [Thermodesulfobacteriota bacterium]